MQIWFRFPKHANIMHKHNAHAKAKAVTVNTKIQTSLATGNGGVPQRNKVETTSVDCGHIENELIDDLRTIDCKQLNLQNQINELKNAFDVASNINHALRQYTDYDGELMCVELNDKVHT